MTEVSKLQIAAAIEPDCQEELHFLNLNEMDSCVCRFWAGR